MKKRCLKLKILLKTVLLSKFRYFQICTISDLMYKTQDHPKVKSVMYRLRFNEGLYEKLDHKTIFRFCYQLMAYYVITLQFSDALDD